MTKLLAFGDTHLGAGRDHRVDSLADQERALQSIADIAHDNRVELIVNAGDTFDRPWPPVAAQHVWRRFVARLELLGIPMVTILGNAGHDQVNSATETAAELHDTRLHRVSRHPELITEFAGQSVCTLPSVPVHRLVAQHPELARGNVNELAARLLLRAAGDLRDQAAALSDRPPLLLAHFSISGSFLPNGLPVDDLAEPVLDLAALEALGFWVIVAGHIHQQGTFGDTALYVGSPLCLSFGEAEAGHGCWLLSDREPPVFVPLPDRQFVTVDVDLTAIESDAAAGLDETDIVAAYIAEQLPLTDAVARVRYRATEEQHRRVDHGALNRLLADAGVHRVYGGIQWQPVYASRARVEGVDETLTPAALIRAWCEANEIAAEAEDALWALTSDYLQGTAA